MYKLQATKKDIKRNFYIIRIPYCKAQYLLNFENPFSYCVGVYGWSCDNYAITTDKIDNVIVSTGYRPIDNKNTQIDYDMLSEAEKKASDIINGDGLYITKTRQVRQLLHNLIHEAIKSDYNV